MEQGHQDCCRAPHQKMFFLPKLTCKQATDPIEEVDGNNQHPGGVPEKNPNAKWEGGALGTGWPALRYFNKETGLAGKEYVQKEQGQKLAEELQSLNTLNKWIAEIAGEREPGCIATDGNHLAYGAKQIEYVKMYENKPPADR
jgi:hypothetical protein